MFIPAVANNAFRIQVGNVVTSVHLSGCRERLEYPVLLKEGSNIPKNGEIIRQPAPVAALVEPKLTVGAGARQGDSLLVRDEVIVLTVQHEDGSSKLRHD